MEAVRVNLGRAGKAAAAYIEGVGYRVYLMGKGAAEVCMLSPTPGKDWELAREGRTVYCDEVSVLSTGAILKRTANRYQIEEET